MKALMFTAIRKLQVVDMSDPRIEGPGDVLLRVRACGICGSDLHGYTGQSGRRTPPLIMGHEAAGEVVAAGPAVKNFHSGDRVVVQPLTTCGVCLACRDDKPQFCSQRSMIGMNTPGAFAEYVVVPEANLFPIPPSVSFAEASLNEPVSVALHAAGRASFKPYETAAIIGTGAIGLLVLSVLRLMGLRRLVVIDLSQERLALARDLGADVTINPTTDDVGAAVRAAVGDRGLDHVFEAVGVESTFQNSIDLVRRGGEIIWIGLNEPRARVDVQAIVSREIDIHGDYGYTPGDFGRALVLQGDGHIPADRLITRTASLEEGPELFQELLRRPDIIKCVFEMPGEPRK